MVGVISGRRRFVTGGLALAGAGVARSAGAVPLPLLPQPFQATPSTGHSVAAPLAFRGTERGERAADLAPFSPSTPPNPEGKPIICIVIDDLGVMRRGTDRILAFAGSADAFLVPVRTRSRRPGGRRRGRGHEATLHMPMQSFSNSTYQTGPDPLRIDLPPAENIARLRAAIAAVPNIVGLNNHMGSVATHDAALMEGGGARDARAFDAVPRQPHHRWQPGLAPGRGRRRANRSPRHLHRQHQQRPA